MVSVRQRLCNGIARAVQKPLLMLPLPQPIARMAFDLNAWLLYQTPRDMVLEPVDMGGAPCTWITRTDQRQDGVLLYLHGGGFVMGSLRSHRHLVAHLAAKSGLRALFVNYRLAPEHPFPAAPDDALAVYRGLLAAGHDPAKISLAGDSAGGCLAMVLLADIAKAGLPAPRAVALISPITDLTGSGASLLRNRWRDPVLPLSWGRRAVAAYLAGQDPENPRISPLWGDLSDLPPIFVQVCESEILRDDGQRLAVAITEAGGQADLRIWHDVPHVWHLMCGRVPEADAGIEEMAAFLTEPTEI
jgi:epsilon-lactone hydrolase